jgi:hypothetical protein
MKPRDTYDRGEEGGAAIEMLLLLPFIILLNCFIMQLSHLFVAYQVAQYAAFAAARAAMVADVDPADAPPGTDWKTKAAGDPEFDRPVRAAAQMCSVLELISFEDFSWHKTPVRWSRQGYTDVTGPPKYRFFPGDMPGQHLTAVKVVLPEKAGEDEVRVLIVYDAYLPVPFANRIIYEGFVETGRGGTTGDLRVQLILGCTVVKPWM